MSHESNIMQFVGEWWKSDTEAVINQAQKFGLAPNVSDAHTINGHPGPISNCLATGRILNTFKCATNDRWAFLCYALFQMVKRKNIKNPLTKIGQLVRIVFALVIYKEGINKMFINIWDQPSLI